jgi:hypothetical protein
LHSCAFALSHGREAETLAVAARSGAQLYVIFDPGSLAAGAIEALPGPTLGVLMDADEPGGTSLAELDRLVSFDPALSGCVVAGQRVWRSIPAPVSDSYYRPVHELRGAPRAMAIGRSTVHRERMLTPAKHHNDLLQVIHGVSGDALAELLDGCDVGVYVAREDDGSYGQQIGLHLAAGQLLLSEQLSGGHGLEVDIDYLCFDSPEGLVWMLERLAVFPEMALRPRVRGRLKAEQFRASRLFARLAHDVLADVAAFG